jgi:hypothetical protein
MNLYILCSIAWAVIVIITAVQIARRTDLNDTSKRVWMAVIIIAPVVGLLLYYFKATPKKLI